ncbi:hypothetical protein ELZ88_24225 (plasmid) [Salmonella enterica subsp. enterica serovar Karamoja]|uniref:DUF2300 domain-containing protein n=1 Tax=Salmonella enterica subsp. enterica serovar Karamoja TaxID=2500153 RepID=A0A3Q9MN35_SALET|nr:hypothetical protein [Salmonella enterica]AZT39648.1 hypothetical protein ELZ88_24225 [Salmonella enterica subsp. enterica serovar Karamoja]AZT44457.1 hypothetical protein EL007_24725 [Salmonella enterica subsp. enterica serovar Karamoja]
MNNRKWCAVLPLLLASGTAFADSPAPAALNRMLSGALADGLCSVLTGAIPAGTTSLSAHDRQMVVSCAWFASERDKHAADVQPLPVWLANHPAFSDQAPDRVVIGAWQTLRAGGAS